MKKFRFCPKCGSKDIEALISVTSYLEGFNRFKCRKCGNEGMFFPEIDEEEYKKVKKKLSKK